MHNLYFQCSNILINTLNPIPSKNSKQTKMASGRQIHYQSLPKFTTYDFPCQKSYNCIKHFPTLRKIEMRKILFCPSQRRMRNLLFGMILFIIWQQLERNSSNSHSDRENR